MIIKKKEIDDLKNRINQENILVRRLGKWAKSGSVLFLLGVALTYWGFSNFTDPFLPNIDETFRTVIKWIALIFTIISGLMTVMSFLSFRNGKKHVLSMINELEGLKSRK